MKAVVLEIRNKKAAVLTHGGQILKVCNKDYLVGQEIYVRETSEKVVDFARNASRWMPAAVAAAFLVVIGRFMCLSLEPYGVVSLDVNPSIEFTINNMDKVLYVNGVNDDGQDIINSINDNMLLNQSIEKAVNVTIDKIESKGYLDGENRNYVVVAANTVKESHTDKLVEKLDRSISANENVQPITMKATDEEVNEARNMGTSPGKMIIVNKLDSVNEESIDKSEWLGRSVADIVNEYDKVTNRAATVTGTSSETSGTVKPVAAKKADTSKADQGKADSEKDTAEDTDDSEGSQGKKAKGNKDTSDNSAKNTPEPTPEPTPVITDPTPVVTQDPSPVTSDPSPEVTEPAPEPTPEPEPFPVITDPSPEPVPDLPDPFPVITDPSPEPVPPAPDPSPVIDEPGDNDGDQGGEVPESSAETTE